MHPLLTSLAQIAASKIDSDTPRVEPASNAVTWIITAVIVVAILLMAFKNARRTNSIDEQP